MTEDRAGMSRRPLQLQPLAAVAVVLGGAAFAAALVLKSIQVGRSPADYYGLLGWLAPEIGLAPLAAFLGLTAAILAGADRNVPSLIIGVLGGALATAGLVIALTHAPPNAMDLNARCMKNVKTIALALTMYEQEHGALPPAARWTQALDEYVDDPEVWKSPFTGRPGYALNAAIAGRRSQNFSENPATVVAVFESDHGADAAGGPALLVREGRHHGGSIVGFLDGHAQWVHDSRLDQAANTQIVWHPHASPRAEQGADEPAGGR